MDNKILVAYASKYGSTKEIAEKIGETLKQAGLETDVISVKSVKDVAVYGTVVLGSAMYVGQWRKEAVNFLKDNEDALTARPLWVFAIGPSGKGDPKDLLKGVIVPNSIKPILDRIKPRDVAVFHGYLNPDKMGGMEKFIVKRVGGELGDFRDWDMINKWATGIAEAVNK